MTIEAVCPCGAHFRAKPELAGKAVRCPTCGQSFQVPAQASPQKVIAECSCGKKYKVKPDLCGKRVRCRACGSQFTVPMPSTPDVPPDVPDPLAEPGPLDGLGDFSDASDPLGGSLPAADPLAGASKTRTLPSRSAVPTRRKPSAKLNRKLIMSVGLGGAVTVAIVLILMLGFLWLPDAKYETPEAVFEAQKQAHADKDWKTLYGTLTTESQDMLAGSLVVASQFGAAGDTELASLLKKHGIDSAPAPAQPPPMSGLADFSAFAEQMQERMGKAADSIEDKEAFFIDIMEYFDTKGEELRQQMGASSNQMAGMTDMAASSQLKDVTVDGDKARGTQSVAIAGQTFDVPIEFRHVAGSWLIHMPSMNERLGSLDLASGNEGELPGSTVSNSTESSLAAPPGGAQASRSDDTIPGRPEGRKPTDARKQADRGDQRPTTKDGRAMIQEPAEEGRRPPQPRLSQSQLALVCREAIPVNTCGNWNLKALRTPLRLTVYRVSLRVFK